MNDALNMFWRYMKELNDGSMSSHEARTIACQLVLAQCIANAGNDLSDIGPALAKLSK